MVSGLGGGINLCPQMNRLLQSQAPFLVDVNNAVVQLTFIADWLTVAALLRVGAPEDTYSTLHANTFLGWFS